MSTSDSAVGIRNGNYMLRTACGKCDATFTSPNRALKHLTKQHTAKEFSEPKGLKPVYQIRWKRDGTIDAIVNGPAINPEFT